MKIKSIVLLLAGLFLCIGSTAQTLSDTEKTLVKKLGFDADLMLDIKKETGKELTQLPAINAATGEVTDGFSNGIQSPLTAEDNYASVKKLKAKFKAKGYLLFVFSDDNDQFSIAVLKGKDELDIVRFRHTDGANYDVTNAAITSKLKAWKAKCDFEVLGCARDWIELSFKTLPKDMTAFSKEIYAFCPDVVDQGAGDVDSLEENMVKFRRLNLWWD